MAEMLILIRGNFEVLLVVLIYKFFKDRQTLLSALNRVNELSLQIYYFSYSLLCYGMYEIAQSSPETFTRLQKNPTLITP